MRLWKRPWDLATLAFLALGIACLVAGWRLNAVADELEGLLHGIPAGEAATLTEEALATEFKEIRQGIHWSQIMARARTLKGTAVGLVAAASFSLVASVFCLWEERLRRSRPSKEAIAPFL